MDVSVIIAALNACGTIERAIRSAIGQTLATIEIIVVDDGSADSTKTIVSDLCLADPRVQLIRHDQRRGVSAARNSAIAAASGEWLAVLDADDWFAPDRLANLVGHGRAHGLDAVIDNLTLVDAATDHVLGRAFPDDWLTSMQPLGMSRAVELDTPHRQRMGLGYCKPVFRRNAFLEHIGRYDIRFRCNEDLLALQLLLFGGALVGTVESAGYFYCINPKSLSNRPGANLDISDINRFLQQEAVKRGLTSIAEYLKIRQIVIDYDAFAKAAHQLRLGEAAIFLRRLPLHIVAMQPLRILGRRFGVDLGTVDPRDITWVHRQRSDA